MSVTVYYFPLSAPSRAVLSFLTLAGVQHEKKVLDILKGEQKATDFLQISPFGVVPAMKEGAYSLFESEAMIRYFINSHRGEEYYPNDPKIRAEIDKYMPFHHTVFRPPMLDYFKATYTDIMHSKLTKKQVRPIVEEALKKFQDVYLKNKKFIAGDQLTIADLFAIAELTMVSLPTDFDFSKFPIVKQYIDRCLMVPAISEVNQPLREFGQEMKNAAVKNKRRFGCFVFN